MPDEISIEAVAELMKQHRLTRVKTAELEIEMHPSAFMAREAEGAIDSARTLGDALPAMPNCQCGHELAAHDRKSGTCTIGCEESKCGLKEATDGNGSAPVNTG